MRIWEKYITDDVKSMYAHYRSEPKIGKRPCLLLIDLYNLSYKGWQPTCLRSYQNESIGMRRACAPSDNTHQKTYWSFPPSRATNYLYHPGLGSPHWGDALDPKTTEKYF